MPISPDYVFKKSERVIIPCRPTHQEVVVSLMKTAQTGRGLENIVSSYTTNLLYLLP